MDRPVTEMTATALQKMLRSRQISSRELFEACWERYEAENPALNAVVQVDPDRAMRDCRAADDAAAKGSFLGPLHGLPMTIKDAIPVAGLAATGGAVELQDHVPVEDAPAVARLRAAGAVIYGKTNLPRWSGDLQSYNEIYGTTNNPWDLRLTPGGSSGGAAAAVASGMTTLELGTDIGGSVRIPAGFCGIYSHKPSFGVVSQRGYMSHLGSGAVDSDINVFGPLARSVDDLELVLDTVAGPDVEDSRAWRLELPPPRHSGVEGVRIGTWLDDPACEVDSEVVGMLEGVAALLSREGAAVSTDRPRIALQESSDLFFSLVRSAISRIGDLDAGRQSGGSYADWIGNSERRAEFRHRWDEYFVDHDVLLCPVTAMTPFPHDQSEPKHDRTVVINGRKRPIFSCLHFLGMVGMAYLPSTVVPIGRTKQSRPVGMQIVGPYLEDKTTLAVAHEVSLRLEGFVPPPRHANGGEAA